MISVQLMAAQLVAALFTPQAAFYSLAAGATQPIFDGFRIQGNFELQNARQEEALQVYRLTVVSSFADVDNALMDIRQTVARVALQRQVVESSRRAFELAEVRELLEIRLDDFFFT